MPTDAAGWLRAFTKLATDLSAAIGLSDMSIAGSPLVYANEAWYEATGYSADEVLGRNCRLLQGPDSEPTAVEAIVAGLRAGVDTCVRITNYRKDGDSFVNLLLLRPVFDSNGVYRFCISVNLEIAGHKAPRIPLAAGRLSTTAQVNSQLAR